MATTAAGDWGNPVVVRPHMALRVSSLEDAKVLLAERGVPITGDLSFGDLRAVFFRDPDRNVIELDEYPGEQPGTRTDGYDEHP